MATAAAIKPSAPKQLPPPNSDFYQLKEMLSADEMAVLKKVRAFMETNVAPSSISPCKRSRKKAADW